MREYPRANHRKPRAPGIQPQRDRDLRLLAEAAAVRPPARQPQAIPTALAAETWTTQRSLLDALGLYTTEVYQKSREEVIVRQQQEMLELSTPVVKLWDGILALPLIGTLDSARTQVVMESLLQRIVETGSTIAILDITGVPTVDTLVAQHLLKTVAAARLMGADCIISGIRPQIAQTIVHLGVDLERRDHQGDAGRRVRARAEARSGWPSSNGGGARGRRRRRPHAATEA